MRRAPAIAFVVVALLIAVASPMLEALTGQGVLYNAVLLVAFAGLWAAFRLDKREMAWGWGGLRMHAGSFVYPLGVMALLAAAAWAAGDVHLAGDPKKIVLNLVLVFLATWVVGLITEEGVYRGALWGMGMRAGWSDGAILVATSLAFAAWHVGVPLVEAEFRLPAWQLPIWLGNVVLLGLAWGLLRRISGSLLVPATAHASWNALAYVFFGYGEKATALHVERSWLFDPERGILGLAVNALVVYNLLRTRRPRDGDVRAREREP